MVNFNCYDKIIGLSDTDCGCSADGRPVDYNESLSGLYLTGLEPLEKLRGLEGCEDGSIWQIMERARDEAVRLFISDINKLLFQEYDLRYPPFDGLVGCPKAQNPINVSGMAGMRLVCKPVKTAMMRVKKVGTLFEQDGTISLEVWDNYGNRLMDSTVLSTTAMSYTENDLSLELPLYSKNGRVEYYFVYTAGANRPLDNRAGDYAEGFRPVFNTHSPYYNYSYTEHYGWANYMMAGGVEVATTDELKDCPAISGSYLNGLVLEADIACDVNKLVCAGEMDFDNNPLAMTVAEAIRYKAGMLLADRFLSSQRLNRESLMHKESNQSTREMWNDIYKLKLEDIAANTDARGCACVRRKPGIEMKTGGIFV